MADLWERIERSTKNVVEKGKEFTEIIQIEREISVQEKEINNFKILIGDYVLNKNLLQEETQIAAYIKEIKERNESIKIKRENILKLKNVKKCPACDFELPLDAKFCKNCGEKIENLEVKEILEGICGKCGNRIAEGAKFCSKCGNQI